MNYNCINNFQIKFYKIHKIYKQKRQYPLKDTAITTIIKLTLLLINQYGCFLISLSLYFDITTLSNIVRCCEYIEICAIR